MTGPSDGDGDGDGGGRLDASDDDGSENWNRPPDGSGSSADAAWMPEWVPDTGPGLGVDPVRTGLVLLAVVVVLGVAVAASFSTAAFGAYNPEWDGTSALGGLADRTGAEPIVALGTADYGRVDPNRTVAFVLAPRVTYGDGEALQVRSFVRRGGTVVVAADTSPGLGHANRLLADLEADARLDGRAIRDDYRHYRGPAMPVAPNVSDHRVTRGVDEITLNYGTVVRPGNATVVVSTSAYSYLDADGDGSFDGGENATESPRAYPVVTVEPVGEGQVVVVGDPSVFINVMLDRPGNERFARTLLEPHDRALLDYSHRESLPPARVGLLVLRRSEALQLLVAFVGATGVGALARWRSGA